MGVVCEEVTVEFSGGGHVVRPLEGLSTRFDDGDLALLLGASGSGKTTLLSVLAAILSPTSGSVSVDGVEVTALTGAELNAYRRERVGIVFQAFNLVPSLNARENVEVPLRAAGRGGREARRRAVELLESFDLGHRLEHRAADMSGGQQQRVAVARALALDPPVVLADEPTAHLDYIQVDGLIRLLRSIADEGRTVIVSTHDERLTPVADRILDMTPAGADDVSFAREVRLAAGEVLFSEGDVGELAYVVKEGEIEIVRAGAGGEELVARLSAGNYFGELAPVLKMPRTATARAGGETVVLALSGAELRQHLQAERTA